MTNKIYESPAAALEGLLFDGMSKRGKTRGGMIIRFTKEGESDSFWICRRPMIWTACRKLS